MKRLTGSFGSADTVDVKLATMTSALNVFLRATMLLAKSTRPLKAVAKPSYAPGATS